MPRQYCNAIIEREVADELGLPLNTVRKIADSQSLFVKIIMESGKFENVRLPYLGRFSAKLKEIQVINHLKGMTEEQAREFRKAVKTGKIKFNWWENKKKKKK